MRGFLLILLAVLAVPTEALACGACVSPPGPTVVKQKAERVLFARDPVTKKSLAWVEVRYGGSPQEFGWVVPMPKVPKIGVGTAYLFDRLDQATAPRFTVEVTKDRENCRAPTPVANTGFGCGSAAASTGAKASAVYSDVIGSADVGGQVNRHVTVLESASVGPYDYQILASDQSQGLLDWLNGNGYATPPAALPIIDSHVKKKDVFVAFKLKNNAGIDAIRPVSFEMDDAEPCVPLRLTSVAAVEDMQVVVYVAGPGRAIPKNHLHVTVNPLRLSWEDAAGNYDQVLAAAIDEASGRAFSTEFAGPTNSLKVAPAPSGFAASQVTFAHPLDGTSYYDAASMSQVNLADTGAYGTGALIDAKRLDVSAFAAVTNLGDLAKVLHDANLPLSDDVVATLNAHATSTDAVDWPETQKTGLPRSGAYDGINAATPVDGAGLAQDLADFATGLKAALTMVNGAQTLTRLVLRISPEEMTRDPVFAFHPALPAVGNVRGVQMGNVCSQGNDYADKVRLAFPDLKVSYLVPGNPPPYFGGGLNLHTATDARFKATPAAWLVEVLDEAQPAQPVADDQISLLDSAIAGAVPGQPTVPVGLTLHAAKPRVTLPPSDKPVDFQAAANAGQADPGGCQARLGWLPPSWLLLLLAAVGTVALRRRAK